MICSVFFPRNILFVTINNAIKTKLNKRMLTKILNLNMGGIAFYICYKIIKDHSLRIFCIKIQNNEITTS